MSILEVEGLCKTYPAFRLRDVSFAVEPGAIMASSAATVPERARPSRPCSISCIRTAAA